MRIYLGSASAIPLHLPAMQDKAGLADSPPTVLSILGRMSYYRRIKTESWEPIAKIAGIR